MFLPIGDDQIKGGAKPIFAYAFIAVNVLVFLYQSALDVEGINEFIRDFGSIPAEVQAGQDLFTLITNMFLHGGFMHTVLYPWWSYSHHVSCIIRL